MQCPYCLESIKAGASACPHCTRGLPLGPDAEASRAKRRRIGFVVALGLLTLAFGVASMAAHDDQDSRCRIIARSGVGVPYDVCMGTRSPGIALH